MLKLQEGIDAYLAVRRAVGFRLEDEERLLRSFEQWASARGETHVHTQTVMSWAASKGSPWRREKKLRAIATFARHASAEDPRHQVPPVGVFRRKIERATPHIYTPEQVRALVGAAEQLPPVWPLRPHVIATLFGLLSSTGLRLSEALGLRLGDITSDGLIIRKTKFNKTRIVPLHPTAAAALERYLERRRQACVGTDYLLVSRRGGRVPRPTATLWFFKLARQLGWRGAPGTRGPRLHDLRHTFAVRALEASLAGAATIGAHALALSTYLGHASVANTDWYLHATPRLMRGIADACERVADGGAA
jgi:integrase/recombinase XerD